jgi:hypothetical protein
MAVSDDGSRWWRRFLGVSQDTSRESVAILRQRYVEEMQQHDRLKHRAEKMHYLQFREKLLQMAVEYQRHAERLAAKILTLGGQLPDVPAIEATNENSWGQLLAALEADARSADHLVEQLRGLDDAHADVADLLQQTSRDQKKHRHALREMMMRSDPFASSLA